MHHWIETGQLERELDDEPVRYKKRPPKARQIDPDRGIIRIRAAGGGYTQVKKDYVRRVRPRPSLDASGPV